MSIFCFDDGKLKRIREVRQFLNPLMLCSLSYMLLRPPPQEYSSGRMLTGEIKNELVQELVPIILEHQRRRAAVTDNDVKAFFTPRRLEFGKK